ncbi:protoporphyrinogen oxidase HemJ [Bartonella sp. HY038]|uniref:protoporphyrinogen oxidase HemJ n=1 Tax=Bartonella sp. HY038 TaxID=2759660 RepID=UPI0015F83464|nr:protoporphyrinogen oxidase HemJ [Bartonella sp. HY038]
MQNEKSGSMSKTTIWIRAIVSLLIVIIGLFLLLKIESPMAQLWFKAVHIIAVISWMAGMLYLPRLFVNHCRVKIGSETSEVFKGMEKRLLRYIINPAMIVTWITGLWLALTIGAFHDGWFHLKFTAVILLSAFHGVLSRGVRLFGQDKNVWSEKTWRILNEVPTILMIIIVISVVVLRYTL